MYHVVHPKYIVQRRQNGICSGIDKQGQNSFFINHHKVYRKTLVQISGQKGVLGIDLCPRCNCKAVWRVGIGEIFKKLYHQLGVFEVYSQYLNQKKDEEVVTTNKKSRGANLSVRLVLIEEDGHF
jgi:Zn-finger nucleic acid-binding protein